MRELDSRAAPSAPTLAQRGKSFGRPFRAGDALEGLLDDRRDLLPVSRVRLSPREGRAPLRTRPNHGGGDGAPAAQLGARDDDDDDADSDGDSDEGKKGKKKHTKGKGRGKGKKKGKNDDDDDDGDDKPKKHPIQPPAPHGPPPSFPHPFPHPPRHLPPPHGPPPKGPHPPFHPNGGTHPKVALSSSAADDTLATPVAKPTKSSASPAEPSAPPESSPHSAPHHESQTYSGGTVTQPVTATTPLPKQGSQPHATGKIEPTVSPAANAKKGFPLAAAGILGGVISFLLVSGIVLGIWFWMRRRRRARAPPAQWDFPPPALRPQPDGITVSMRTISTTVPQFARAAEAGAPSRAAANANPFAHRDDGRERDPFASAPPTLRLGTIDAPLSRMFI